VRVIERSSRCHVLVERPAKEPTAASPGEIRAFAKCRNERLRLPAFLKHYRDLGVGRFFIVDNDSSDGTTEYLADQPDVRRFTPSGTFREAGRRTEWLNALLAEFGEGHWCVTVDIDECSVIQAASSRRCARSRRFSIGMVTRPSAVFCSTCIPAGRWRLALTGKATTCSRAAPYFDAGPYDRIPIDLCPGFLIRGGMRERIFYPNFRTRGAAARIYEGVRGRVARRLPRLHNVRWLRPTEPPVLTKVPLVRWGPADPIPEPALGISKAGRTSHGRLAAFQVSGRRSEPVAEETVRGQKYAGAAEYRRYAQTLADRPDNGFLYEGSTQFAGTQQLVQLGLMHDAQAWSEARTGSHA
jgi:hypothetical protein